MDTGSLVLMIVVSFSLAFIIILKKDTIPAKVRRPLATLALLLVASSFVMMVIALYRM